MLIDTIVNRSITQEKHACIAGRAVELVRRTWRRLYDPTLLGVGAILAMLVVAITIVSSAGCGGGTPPPATNGSISLAWSIADLNGQTATCAQVGARSVALRLRNRASGNVIATAFPCTTNPSTTQVAAGRYDIAFDLNAADGTRLATAPAQTGVAIVAGQVQRLTPIRFIASTQSGLVISLAAPPTTANCGPPAMGGAGINGTTITLQRAAGGCVPVTFVRSLAGKQVGMYTVNCSSPAVAACIERNETLTTSVTAGTYVVHATGRVGAIDCWQGDATLVVTPGKPLTQTLNLAHQSVPGC
jgi:hypothetical protein